MKSPEVCKSSMDSAAFSRNFKSSVVVASFNDFLTNHSGKTDYELE
jgi:hypothetical protein